MECISQSQVEIQQCTRMHQHRRKHRNSLTSLQVDAICNTVCLFVVATGMFLCKTSEILGSRLEKLGLEKD